MSWPKMASFWPNGACLTYRRNVCHSVEAEMPANKAATAQTATPPQPTYLRTDSLRGSRRSPCSVTRYVGARRRASSTLSTTITKNSAKAATPTITCQRMRVQNTERKPTSPNHSQST